MASLQLGMNATTIHHWAGIFDGRYSHECLQDLIDNDDRFTDAKARILQTDCLIIDEISMLSSRTFDMVEFVCRHIRKNNSIFGGLQVIGSGDFKQLPPVPNSRYQDDGSYCFQSANFCRTFPHHINLKEVFRQKEPILINAVNELCNGNPSEETISFLKSLERPFEGNIQDQEVTRLFGTNFDASVVNQDMLEEIPGEMFHFKARDEGDTRLLRKCVAPKHLVLKVGAKVILIKNISKDLCNGKQGIVHFLEKDKPPVINFDGNLVPLTGVKFDVYDMQQEQTLACRTQIPIVLAFALTVHRAQGQTLNLLEIDCYSFFAPGQMGVAVGRAITSSGLRIINLNKKAAFAKHSDLVYNFYDREFLDFSTDLACCQKQQVHPSVPDDQDSNITLETEPATSSVGLHGIELDHQIAQLQSPWDINDFLIENQSSTFMNDFPPDFFKSQSFAHHLHFLYFKICEILKDNPKSSQGWTKAYGNLNNFLVGENHLSSAKKMFKTSNLTNNENKLSTKLTFWLVDKEIAKKAQDVVKKQTEKTKNIEFTQILSSAARGKLRYLAGACIQKIATRVRESVLRKIGKTSKKNKFLRKLEYKKQALLRTFRIKEEEADFLNDSMTEIECRQGPTHGLTIVSEPVFSFFISLNETVQKNISFEHFNLYHKELHSRVRTSVDLDISLIEEWISLFEHTSTVQSDDGVEDGIFLSLIMELYRDVTEHFIKICFVDALKNFKRTVPRKKKQALRTRVQALGERDATKKLKVDVQEAEELFICNICNCECEWEPTTKENESIACDKCNCWYHYKCVNLKGNESFLLKQNSTWYCSGCSRKGKGRGKGKSTSNK